MVDQVRRLSPLLLVAVALLAAGAAAVGPGLTAGPRPPREEEAPLLPEQTPAGAVTAGPEQVATEPIVHADYPGWLTWPVTILFAGIVAGAIGLFLYLLVRYLLTERVIRRPVIGQAASQPDGALTTAEVQAAVRAGLADIDAGGDPRRAVIACWLRLERIAASAGTVRLAADTPADLVARLLAAHRVDDSALARLANTYRLARYAPSEVGEELVTGARRALSDVASKLDHAPATPAESGR